MRRRSIPCQALLTNTWRHAARGVVALALIGCAGSDDTPFESQEQPLIGGTAADESQFPSAVFMTGAKEPRAPGSNTEVHATWSGAKVGARALLVAATSLFKADGAFHHYAHVGNVIRVTASNDIRPETFREFSIESINIFPGFLEACRPTQTCDGGLHAPFLPNIAVLTISGETPDIPVAQVDASPAEVGERVVLTGFGCTQADGPMAGLHYEAASLGGQSLLVASGSDKAQISASYLLTPGLPGLGGGAQKTCPGDLGAPLFRENTNLIVGVTSTAHSYALGHTRVDADSASSVAAWLKGLGVNVSETRVARPFAGKPISIPGVIQAEDYDRGGRDVAYSDTDRINQPGAHYRNDAVDIDPTSDEGGGFNIGGIQPGEWLKYSVEVSKDGAYDVEIRAASRIDKAKLHLEIDGSPVTPSIELVKTDDFQSYASTFVRGVNLSAGSHSLTLRFETNGFNLNFIRFNEATSGGEAGAAAGGASGGDAGAAHSPGKADAGGAGGAPGATSGGAPSVTAPGRGGAPGSPALSDSERNNKSASASANACSVSAGTQGASTFAWFALAVGAALCLRRKRN